MTMRWLLLAVSARTLTFSYYWPKGGYGNGTVYVITEPAGRTMRLYIVQHGDAVPKDINPDRPLSDRGRADIGRLAEWLSSRNVQVGHILHSGKVRAKETAEILRPLLKSRSQIHASDGLAPNDSPEAFLDQLRRARKDTLVASHMPFVTRTISQALTGAPDRQLVEFVPGSIAGIESNDGASWRLFMFTRPEFLDEGKISREVD